MTPAKVHLKAPAHAPARLTQTNGQPFRLDEPAPPDNTPDRSQRHVNITRALDVRHSLRYQPQEADGAATTYCNVYAYDWCDRAGVYLPRVWWRQPTSAPTSPDPTILGQSDLGARVQEVSANSLFDWFGAFATRYGWTQLDANDGRTMQLAANRGDIVVISGRRVGPGSGHVSIVIPDVQGTGLDTQDGRYVPMQAQAGARCFDFERAHPWWWSAEHHVSAWTVRAAQ